MKMGVGRGWGERGQGGEGGEGGQVGMEGHISQTQEGLKTNLLCSGNWGHWNLWGETRQNKQHRGQCGAKHSKRKDTREQGERWPLTPLTFSHTSGETQRGSEMIFRVFFFFCQIQRCAKVLGRWHVSTERPLQLYRKELNLSFKFLQKPSL